MRFFEYKEFRSSILALTRKGGSFSKAASVADALIGKVAREDANPLHGLLTTDNGESRIDNCVKYDLVGRSRLVTVQINDYCLLLFVGDHNTVDKWLNRNKGIKFTLNSDKKFEVVKRLSLIVDSSAGDYCIEDRLIQASPLFEMLDEKLFDRLCIEVPRKSCRKLESIGCFDESKLKVVVDELEGEIQTCVLDVFLTLISGDIKEAERCIKLYLGDIESIESIDADAEIVDSEFLKKISQNSEHYPKYLRRFAEEGEYHEWMLFMHPDQEAIAFSDFNGPAKLLGVSGSGKTCVVIQRALYLAKKYPGEDILVVTLNKPLASLIENLVNKLSEKTISEKIEVSPFFKVCQDILLDYEPENEKIYEDVTWKSGEHIDEVWREYYRCELGNNEASILNDLHDSLISRGIDSEHYIKEEFDWVRSAYSEQDRSRYLSVKRQGRTVPLNEKYRALVLKGLTGWERKMRAVGVTDYLNISTALYNHIDKLDNKYRCILIDESQDFGNIEFSIARKLVACRENDIFLCGDAAQQISTKYQNLKEIGIQIHGSRSKKITKNYRNSREILEFANSVLMQNLTDEMLKSEDFEILEPEYASFSGSNPLLLKSNSLILEIDSAVSYIKTLASHNQKACICIAGFSQREIKVYADRIGYPVLDGKIDISSGSIFFSELEQTKGFEFDYVCILNCTNGIIPDPLVPKDEHFRELSRLYVAMTRAKLELIVSYSGKQSELFTNSDDYFISGDWVDHITEVKHDLGQPEKLSEVVHPDDTHTADPVDMDGDTFLYRKEAIGLSTNTVEFIRENVDGSGKITKTTNMKLRRTKWRAMGDLLSDVNNQHVLDHKIAKGITEELLNLTLINK
jgi:superfamily I DNA/RNA helicase